MIRLLKAHRPKAVLKMFDVVEIDYFSQISGKTVERVLEDLIEAGLQAMPGGVRNSLHPGCGKFSVLKKFPPNDGLKLQR